MIRLEVIGLPIDNTKRSFHKKALAAKSDRISKVLQSCIIILLILVAVIQAALQNDHIRRAITSVENSEGMLLKQTQGIP